MKQPQVSPRTARALTKVSMRARTQRSIPATERAAPRAGLAARAAPRGAADPAAIAWAVVGQIPGSAVLRIRDDSMDDSKVAIGDAVVLERCRRPSDGELAAVTVRGGPTVLRRIHHTQGELRLVSDYGGSEQHVPRSEVQVRGRVVAIVRSRA